jgi:hypothetical protein
MKHLMLLAGIILLGLSCKKTHTEQCPTDVFHYDVYANKKIDTISGAQSGMFVYQINNGANRVFEFIHDNEPCAHMVDGGYTRYVVFEIPSDVTGFNYAEEDLQVINCYTRVVCFCAGISARAVTHGNIKGQKLASGKWRVQMNITIPGSNETITFDKIFTPK